MKKKTKIFAIHAAVLAAIVVAVVFFMRDASDILHGKAYDTKAPASKKIEMLAPWLPSDRDFYFTMDVPRALAAGPLSEKISAIVSGKEGVAAELIAALIQNQNALGMLAIAGKLGDLGEKSDVVVVAQGNFDEKTIVPAIRSAMSDGRAGLAAQDLGWSTLYFESDSRDPFGFMLLDKQHMAAGSKDSLLKFYETKPQKSEEATAPAPTDDVLSGYVSIGERIRGAAPKEIYLPDGAFIKSPDGVQLLMTIPCNDPAKAQSIIMFLEGLRSLVTIQGKEVGGTGLGSLINGISISVEGGDVLLKGELIPLISLWTQSPQTTPPQNPPIQQAPQQ